MAKHSKINLHIYGSTAIKRGWKRVRKVVTCCAQLAHSEICLIRLAAYSTPSGGPYRENRWIQYILTIYYHHCLLMLLTLIWLARLSRRVNDCPQRGQTNGFFCSLSPLLSSSPASDEVLDIISPKPPGPIMNCVPSSLKSTCSSSVCEMMKCFHYSEQSGKTV